MKPSAEEYSRLTKAAILSGDYKAALRHRLEYVSRLNDHYLDQLGYEFAEQWPEGEKPILSTRFEAAARSTHRALESQGENRDPLLYAVSRICVALSNTLAELEQAHPSEIERVSRLLLIGAGLGSAYGLDEITDRIDEAIAAQKIAASLAGSKAGGLKSGVARRHKASLSWQPHARELARAARKEAPKASQDDVVAEIQFGWKEQEKPPGTRTLKAFVSQLEKAGEIPARLS